MIKQGNLRADKVKYSDGIGCCIWYPLTEDNETASICFDFSYSDINDFIKLLQKLKKAKAEKFKEEK